MDEIEITQRLRTTLVRGQPSTWTEVEVSTREAGIITVLRPSDAEIERGEADLAVEHLMSEAVNLRSDLLRLRRAFRSARDSPTPPRMLRPLFAPISSDDGSVYFRPAASRGGMFIVVGALAGILGELASADPAFIAVLSVALMVYGGIGLIGLGPLYTRIELSRGVSVPIRLGPAPHGTGTAMTADFRGPYGARPGIAVQAAERAIQMEPYVEVVDARGRAVWGTSARHYGGPDDWEQAAIVMLREADRLVEALTQREADAALALRLPQSPGD